MLFHDSTSLRRRPQHAGQSTAALIKASSSVLAEVLEGRRLLASVSSLTLINADSNQALSTALPNNGTVTIDLKSARHLNIRANTSSAASVRFGYDSNNNYRTESVAPYAFAADDGNGDYYSWTPSVGTHTVSAIAYSGSGAGGSASSPYKVTLKVVDTSATSTPSGDTSAYLGTPPSIPSQTVLFDNFNNGGEGVGYHDSDSTNAKGAYRNGGVDIEATTDSTPSNLQSSSGTGNAVGTVKPGEWLKYTTNITTAGTYKLSIRFASANSGGTVHLEVDGNNVGAISLTNTGGWQTWKTFEKAGIVLPAGKHTLKFVVDTASGDLGNLHWFKFSTSSGTTPPPTTTPSSSVRWPSSWQSGPAAPSPRFESADHVMNGKLYAFGGFKNSDFDVDRTFVSFNPANNTWTKLGTLPVGMAETHLGVADDGKYIYFVGGFGGDFRHNTKPTQIASNKVWRYDPAANQWLQLKGLPSARGAGGAAVVNGKLHYFGGNPSDRVTNIGEHLVLDLSNPDAGWKGAKSMPDAKDHFSTIVIGSKIYALGGEHGHDQLAQISHRVDVYDTNTDTWTRLADMPYTNSHSEGGTSIIDGQIVFAGGQFNHEQDSTNRVVAYNPATNTWKELKPLPVYRQGAIIQAVGNKVIVTLGAQYTSHPQSGTWIGYRY